MNGFTLETKTQAFYYDQPKLSNLLAQIIKENSEGEVWNWLSQQASSANNAVKFNAAFTQAARKAGKAKLSVKQEYREALDEIYPPFSIEDWTADRLCRIWLVLQLDGSDKNYYTNRIENLFGVADMNEQVALYSSLALLAYPQSWRKRCAEGIRSNIGDVLQAIMCNNPYPAAYLEEPAWNQMVLKALFTEKPVHKIIGLEERANPELAHILLDYAHERWAADRTVNPQLWRCVGKFINNENIQDIERLFASNNDIEIAAAALACSDSNYTTAKELLEKNKDLENAIASGELTWNKIAQQE